MFNLFKRTAKNPAAAPDTVEPAPVPVADEAKAPVDAAATPAPVSDAIPDSIFWSGTSINDDLTRVEEKWQDGILVLRADLPGVDPDRDIRLTVRDRHLVIEAERHQENTIRADGYVIEEASCASLTRVLPIRDGVDASSITGTYKDGVLEVRVPMPSEVTTEPVTRIPVTT